MYRWPAAFVVGMLAAIPLRAATSDCLPCHEQIVASYARTGMGRSFYTPAAAAPMEKFGVTYYHQPSDSYYVMLQRAGKLVQRRYQLDPDGKVINNIEKPVDFILGSGNHSRAYLSRTKRGTLIELPLAWYSEKGGYWGMNPGYDQPHNDGFRRSISYACMFCHNAYPQIPASNYPSVADPVYSGTLPAGIDCERCHGPAGQHVATAKRAGATREQIRAAIVNPARLTADRQMEVCMQCHLETTSFPLPNALDRYERGPFAYRPGQPLADSTLFFDHARGSGRENKFEIVNAVYRLRQSACFLKSVGRLTCTTCHNPHDVPRGEAAVRYYDEACRSCHVSGEHMKQSDCAGCHMPKRRTEDVIHVVMTDHLIQRRRAAADLLADRPEMHDDEAAQYRGPVVLYYPAKLPKPADALYVALAQVIEKSNLREGIAQLKAAIERWSPTRPEYYLDLGEAYRNRGELASALPWYDKAVERDPKFAYGWQKLGVALRRSGRAEESVNALQKAVDLEPRNPVNWHELGLSLRNAGKKNAAVQAIEVGLGLDPDMWAAHNNLGVIWMADHDAPRAEAAFREAIRIQPDYADAHANLANLRAAAGDAKDARYHFELAIRLGPNDASTRYNYGVFLGRQRDYEGAQRELEAALQIDPKMADAQELVGDLLLAKGHSREAIAHYREVLRFRPDSEHSLGVLRQMAADRDPALRSAAIEALRQSGK